MMKQAFLAVMAAMALASAPGFAANGGYFIGVTPASVSMGGTGTGSYISELDAQDKNPALLGDHSCPNGARTTVELTLGMFSNNPSATINGTTASSKGWLKPLPSGAVSYKWTDQFTIGAAFGAIGGASSDFTGATTPGIYEIKINEYLYRGSINLAYTFLDNTLSIGAGPILTMSYLQSNSDANSGGGLAQTTHTGDSQSGLGAQLGVAWKTPLKGLTLGSSYRSQTTLNFKNNVNFVAISPNPLAPPVFSDVQLQTPAEFALGLGYSFSDDIKVQVDYRYIAWSKAALHSDLGWNDQNVISVGGEYKATKALAIRAGVNYGQSPIQSNLAEANSLTPISFQGHPTFPFWISALNLTANPGITEWHIGLGAGYQVSDALNVDIGGMFAPQKTVSRAGTQNAVDNSIFPTTYTMSDTNSQWQIALAGSYKF
jgi:long-chain fatty acid transport protein